MWVAVAAAPPYVFRHAPSLAASLHLGTCPRQPLGKKMLSCATLNLLCKPRTQVVARNPLLDKGKETLPHTNILRITLESMLRMSPRAAATRRTVLISPCLCLHLSGCQVGLFNEMVLVARFKRQSRPCDGDNISCNVEAETTIRMQLSAAQCKRLDFGKTNPQLGHFHSTKSAA